MIPETTETNQDTSPWIVTGACAGTTFVISMLGRRLFAQASLRSTVIPSALIAALVGGAVYWYQRSRVATPRSDGAETAHRIVFPDIEELRFPAQPLPFTNNTVQSDHTTSLTPSEHSSDSESGPVSPVHTSSDGERNPTPSAAIASASHSSAPSGPMIATHRASIPPDHEACPCDATSSEVSENSRGSDGESLSREQTRSHGERHYFPSVVLSVLGWTPPTPALPTSSASVPPDHEGQQCSDSLERESRANWGDPGSDGRRQQALSNRSLHGLTWNALWNFGRRWTIKRAGSYPTQTDNEKEKLWVNEVLTRLREKKCELTDILRACDSSSMLDALLTQEEFWRSRVSLVDCVQGYMNRWDTQNWARLRFYKRLFELHIRHSSFNSCRGAYCASAFASNLFRDFQRAYKVLSQVDRFNSFTYKVFFPAVIDCFQEQDPKLVVPLLGKASYRYGQRGEGYKVLAEAVLRGLHRTQLSVKDLRQPEYRFFVREFFPDWGSLWYNEKAKAKKAVRACELALRLHRLQMDPTENGKDLQAHVNSCLGDASLSKEDIIDISTKVLDGRGCNGAGPWIWKANGRKVSNLAGAIKGLWDLLGEESQTRFVNELLKVFPFTKVVRESPYELQMSFVSQYEPWHQIAACVRGSPSPRELRKTLDHLRVVFSTGLATSSQEPSQTRATNSAPDPVQLPVELWHHIAALGNFQYRDYRNLQTTSQQLRKLCSPPRAARVAAVVTPDNKDSVYEIASLVLPKNQIHDLARSDEAPQWFVELNRDLNQNTIPSEKEIREAFASGNAISKKYWRLCRENTVMMRRCLEVGLASEEDSATEFMKDLATYSIRKQYFAMVVALVHQKWSVAREPHKLVSGVQDRMLNSLFNSIRDSAPHEEFREFARHLYAKSASFQRWVNQWVGWRFGPISPRFLRAIRAIWRESNADQQQKRTRTESILQDLSFGEFLSFGGRLTRARGLGDYQAKNGELEKAWLAEVKARLQAGKCELDELLRGCCWWELREALFTEKKFWLRYVSLHDCVRYCAMYHRSQEDEGQFRFYSQLVSFHVKESFALSSVDSNNRLVADEQRKQARISRLPQQLTLTELLSFGRQLTLGWTRSCKEPDVTRLHVWWVKEITARLQAGKCELTDILRECDSSAMIDVLLTQKKFWLARVPLIDCLKHCATYHESGGCRRQFRFYLGLFKSHVERHSAFTSGVSKNHSYVDKPAKQVRQNTFLQQLPLEELLAFGKLVVGDLTLRALKGMSWKPAGGGPLSNHSEVESLWVEEVITRLQTRNCTVDDIISGCWKYEPEIVFLGSKILDSLLTREGFWLSHLSLLECVRNSAQHDGVLEYRLNERLFRLHVQRHSLFTARLARCRHIDTGKLLADFGRAFVGLNEGRQFGSFIHFNVLLPAVIGCLQEHDPKLVEPLLGEASHRYAHKGEGYKILAEAILRDRDHDCQLSTKNLRQPEYRFFVREFFPDWGSEWYNEKTKAKKAVKACESALLLHRLQMDPEENGKGLHAHVKSCLSDASLSEGDIIDISIKVLDGRGCNGGGPWIWKANGRKVSNLAGVIKSLWDLLGEEGQTRFVNELLKIFPFSQVVKELPYQRRMDLVAHYEPWHQIRACLRGSPSPRELRNTLDHLREVFSKGVATPSQEFQEIRASDGTPHPGQLPGELWHHIATLGNFQFQDYRNLQATCQQLHELCAPPTAARIAAVTTPDNKDSVYEIASLVLPKDQIHKLAHSHGTPQWFIELNQDLAQGKEPSEQEASTEIAQGKEPSEQEALTEIAKGKNPHVKYWRLCADNPEVLKRFLNAALMNDVPEASEFFERLGVYTIRSGHFQLMAEVVRQAIHNTAAGVDGKRKQVSTKRILSQVVQPLFMSIAKVSSEEELKTLRQVTADFLTIVKTDQAVTISMRLPTVSQPPQSTTK